MAVITVCATLNVSGVLTDGGHPVMTRAASAQHLSVINRESGCPDIRVMAVLADVGRLYVRRRLACRLNAVVAAHAVTRDIHVVKVCWQPTDSGVTVVAIGATGNVCRVLADGSGAIMTRTASAHYLRVVNRYGRIENERTVAIFADIACLYVLYAFANRGYAIVAADAIPGDA